MWNCGKEDFIKAIFVIGRAADHPGRRYNLCESSDPVEEPDLYVPMKKQGERKYITHEEPLRERASR